MIEKFEVVLLLLGIFVLVFILANKDLIKHIPSSELLISGFLMFFISWILTNLEHIFWYEILNLLEHTFQLIGIVIITIWCWIVFIKKGGEK